MNGVDLFSGIGGISLALQKYVRTIAYCEIEPFAQQVLLARQKDGSLDPAPIWDDVRSFPARQFLGSVDIVSGGFPCQDLSCAGRRAGIFGNNSGLFWELLRVVEEAKPRFVFLENVPAIRTNGLKEVVTALSQLGYISRWTCHSARGAGAPHRRKRWFLLAYADRERCDEGKKQKLRSEIEAAAKQVLAGVLRPRSGRFRESWENIDRICRVDDGVSDRVDRVKALGNAVVPAQVLQAFEWLYSNSEPELIKL